MYGLATVTLLCASTGYHSVAWRLGGRTPRLRLLLHIADRAAIYVFMAASYAPLLHRALLPSIVPLHWASAIAGTLYQVLFRCSI